MPRILLLALIATFMAALPALAESWALVTRDDMRTDYYIDTESVEKQNQNGT